MDEDSMSEFVSRMKCKYSKYMDLADKRSDIESKRENVKEYTEDKWKEAVKDKNTFLNKEDIDLLFPGHIKSYYVSAEF